MKEIFPGNSLNVELFGTEEGFRDAARIWICEREMLFLGIRNLRTGIMVAGGIAVYRYPQSGKRVFRCLFLFTEMISNMEFVWVS